MAANKDCVTESENETKNKGSEADDKRVHERNQHLLNPFHISGHA